MKLLWREETRLRKHPGVNLLNKVLINLKITPNEKLKIREKLSFIYLYTFFNSTKEVMFLSCVVFKGFY